MQGLEDASKAEVRNDEVSTCGTEWKNTHSQCVGRRWCRKQSTPQLLKDTSGGSPASGGSSDWEAKCSHQLTMMRGSRESNWAGRTGQGLRVKVNLLIFMEEKDQECSDVPFLAVGHSYFPLLGLGWPTLVAVCPLVITGVPWRSCQEFRQGCYLNQHLVVLDKYYGMVMTFDTLSKELYSIKQGSRGNVAMFRVCLLQQVQILHSEYLRRIQQEHVEEMKWDHFYKGLNPNYLHMLAHKMDGEHPASYSYLLLVAQKLERQVEARYPLLPKTTTTGGSNVTPPQAVGNLFPPRKLKGNHIFMAWSAVVESIGTEGDLSVRPDGEEKAESSDGGNQETPSEIGEADHLISYIVHFSNTVKLYQKKNWNCFGCGSPNHLVKDYPKDLSKVTREASLNAKERATKKGGCTPQKPVVTQLASLDKAPRA